MGSNLGWFIGVIAILWVAWFVTGGPERGKTDKPLLKPPAPLDSGDTYGSGSFLSSYQRKPAGTNLSAPAYTSSGSIRPPTTSGTSAPRPVSPTQAKIFENTVAFSLSKSVATTDPQKEYVEIVADRRNTQPIGITGWEIKSAVTGKGIKIGNGAYLPETGAVNTELPIFLRPGEKAYVVTGRSPIGSSFRLNKCTGYFEQFQNFTPTLPLECPSQKTEVLPAGLSDKCLDYVERLPRCQIVIKGIPYGLESACHEYISRKVNYTGCVEANKNDSDFYKPQWRVFLGRSEEFWKSKRETILLYNERGVLIDSLSY